ncbi:oxidoreductase-like protein [Leptotrombidium deliense]|uniref:Oxidoreductase-like protein n=1 Tax=Leptotrombidium deliense TaxID=299467 RepID=A0A443S4L5_9ACAR|nr:oxidoreductase-like protein [Leptotrombidium deliense]
MADTKFLNHMGLDEDMVNDMKKAYAEVNPLGRIGRPIDVANLIAFLASENACYINGVDYVVDGGALYENWPSLE